MMNLTTNGPLFLETERGLNPRSVNLFGAPFDMTTSFRPGARFAPDAIRLISDALESYSPSLDRDLEDCNLYDAGNLPFNVDHAAFYDSIGVFCRHILAQDGTFLMLGGDHSVTPEAVRAAHEKRPDMVLVQLDAHADLRESFNGSRQSHASAMRRCLDFLAPTQLVQVGIRSGTRGEFYEMRQADRLIPPTAEALEAALGTRPGPIYVTIDIDVFDPSLVPGTGTQEAGGIFWHDFEALLSVLSKREWIAADLVELAPAYDPTERSTIVAAKIVRELLLLLAR